MITNQKGCFIILLLFHIIFKIKTPCYFHLPFPTIQYLTFFFLVYNLYKLHFTIIIVCVCVCTCYCYCAFYSAPTGKLQALLSIIPTIIPKIPRAEAKISTIKILTNNEASCASAMAQLDPAIPTDTPDAMLVRPTESPAENIPYPAK